MHASPPVLSVSHLTTRLKIGNAVYNVVDDLSFDLYPGKTLALVGESGCGKSMTALSLMRILPSRIALPPEGSVIYQNQNLLTLPEPEMRKIRGSRIAMIFQDPASALNPVFSIGDQLTEVAFLHLDLDDDAAEALAIQALADVGIVNPADRMSDYPHQLSGGMKQRVMIAMALLCQPDILIADEPTTALDVTVQAQVLDLLRELQRKKGTALLLITHDLGVVAEMADDVIVMYAAQSVEKGTRLQVFDEQAHPYTEGLFQSRPSVDTPRGSLKPIPGTVPSLGHYPSGCHYHPRCPYVMPICRHGAVPEFPCGEPEHLSRCWLRDPNLEQAP